MSIKTLTNCNTAFNPIIEACVNSNLKKVRIAFFFFVEKSYVECSDTSQGFIKSLVGV